MLIYYLMFRILILFREPMEDVFLEDVLEPITILLTMVLRIGSFYRQGRVDRSSNIGSEVNPDSD